MTKRQKIFVIVLSCCCVGAVLLLAAVHFWLSGMRSYELHLPDFGDLKGVALTQKGGEEIHLMDAYGEDVLFILKGQGRSTRTESVQDAPVNVEDWIKIDLRFHKAGTSTLFVYQKPSREGEYFIEQPYNGIYEISGDEYNSIKQYAHS
ncbi:hypothetical protein D7X94_14320 [Acutalibacter sp. 1XD8-33]|uniref:DUF5301 domain-containing protein n=1 Tax=Acutalibacter sp. 1XD8-33 TaxID=2320081 RepID=UPI000EA0CB65|nr:DUF5301 domain-containing protein [Acutalibacter sp. 1XD8-33]RKJ38914.1 hypothetical protein D7X94_14320 [Acutalibacter sp. 1XD8-33]